MQLTPEQQSDLIEALNSRLTITRRHIKQMSTALPDAMKDCGLTFKVLRAETEAIVNADALLLSFINNADAEKLDEVHGIGEASVDEILANRPFGSREEIQLALTAKQVENVEKYLQVEGD